VNNVPRPRHISIRDELGLTKSMPADKSHFEWRAEHPSDEAPVIFLGLGPEPDKVPEWFGLPDDEPVFYLESPDFVEQVEGWLDRVPANFRPLAPEDCTGASLSRARVARYLPVQKAFPSFYGPLAARLALADRARPRLTRTVWLPAGDHALLVEELARAFTDAGWRVVRMDHESLGKHPGKVLPDSLREGVPDLFFSVNFRGLDPFGLGQAILREAGVKVAVWMVDNPFNLLTGVKTGAWRELNLFVTDHSFIGPLIENGARRVTHLPLAASPALFESGGTLPDHARDIEGRLIFVGRSRFPDRDKFFAGETVPEDAADLVAGAAGPTRFDYHWWRDRLGIGTLWPGNRVRAVGAGAEFASNVWKRRCLNAAGRIAVFGDDGWRDLDNPDADVRPVVDYYAHLPALYRAAGVVLNITGMQLPAGLNQRNFDVWCAGGFLLTDIHPGLGIFPDELVDPIAYSRPGDIHDMVIRHREETPEKRALRRAWRECILRDHTYRNRVETIFRAMNFLSAQKA
jgi:spore maturation protein CgeB